MRDMVIKGTGNSRYLKSAIPADITHAQLVELLRNGTFPFDFNGVNQAGITQQGDTLNKATLLKDATAALYGLGVEAVPDDVLARLSKAIINGGEGGYTDVTGAAVPQVKIKSGSYVGTGTYGSGNPCVIELDFTPEIVFVMPEAGADGTSGGKWYSGYIQKGGTRALSFSMRDGLDGDAWCAVIHADVANKQVSWWSESQARYQFNVSGLRYYYLAIGL